MRRLLLRGAAVLVTAAVLPGSRATGAPGVDAAAVVRAFERNPKLRLRSPDPTPDRKSLVFHEPLAPEYRVDLQRGRVWYVRYPAPELPAGVQGNLSPAEAMKSARSFAASHFPEFMRRSLKGAVIPSGPGAGGRPLIHAAFREALPENGAFNGNRLAVDVDTRTGKVAGAELTDESVPGAARRAPSVTKERAVQIATRAAKLAPLLSSPGSELVWKPGPEGRLTWDVRLRGLIQDRAAATYAVAVDAGSGAVLKVRHVLQEDKAIAGPGECLLVTSAARGPFPGSGATVVSLRPRSHEGKLWMPARFAELFGFRPAVRGTQAELLAEKPRPQRVRVPAAQLDGQDFLPADQVLKAAAFCVNSFDEDPGRGSLTIYLGHPAPIMLARRLKLGTLVVGRSSSP